MTGSFFAEGTEETGVVKFFKNDKGYGFVRPDSGQKDVFLHISALRKAGHGNVEEGDRIRYVSGPGRGKPGREVTRVISIRRY